MCHGTEMLSLPAVGRQKNSNFADINVNFTSWTLFIYIFCRWSYSTILDTRKPSCVNWMPRSEYHTTLFYTSENKKIKWSCCCSLTSHFFCFSVVRVPRQLCLSCWKVNVMWFWSELHPMAFLMVTGEVFEWLIFTIEGHVQQKHFI